MMAAPKEEELLQDYSEPSSSEAYEWEAEYWLKYPYYSDDFASEVMERYGQHVQLWGRSPIATAIWNSYRMYHGLAAAGSSDPVVSLMQAGESGELMSMVINQYRGLLRHQIAMVTANRPDWDPQARTSDSAAAQQINLARNVLDYEMYAKLLVDDIRTQKEMEKVCGAAFCANGWDANQGKAGGVWTTILAPWEVRHERVRSYKDCNWWIFRRFEDKWNWVARFAKSDPDKAKRVAEIAANQNLLFGVNDAEDMTKEWGDRIPVLYVYANRTTACPDGRLSIVAAGDITLYDGPLPYPTATISRMCSSEFIGTDIPYSDSWSIMAVAEAYNAALSAILTRVDLFSVPNIAKASGSEFEASDVGGANLIDVPPGSQPPTVVDLLTVPQALPAFADQLKKIMEELTGINSVTRGNPTENITSGSMAALLQSMAVQFNSADEQSFTINLEQVGTHILGIYRAMASEEQLIAVAGQDQRWSARAFKGEDLSEILRVFVKRSNALMKTVGGRKDIADQMLMNGIVKQPAEYLQVVNTGELSPIFAGPTSELTFIKSENERMLRGEPVQSVETDNHALHLREHKGVLDAESRFDPKIRAAVEGHIAEHFMSYAKLSRESPDFLIAMGVEPLPGAMQVGQMANAAPPAQGGPPPQEMPGAPEGKKPGPAPAPSGAENPTSSPRIPAPAKPPEVP